MSDLTTQKVCITVLRDFILKNNEVLNYKIAELQKVCPHDEVVTNKKYHPGDFYDYSYIIITNTCALCDKVISAGRDHSHRGSYA